MKPTISSTISMIPPELSLPRRPRKPPQKKARMKNSDSSTAAPTSVARSVPTGMSRSWPSHLSCPLAPPSPPRKPTAPSNNTMVLRRLAAICSYTAALHVHLNRPADRLVDLEELAWPEAERSGDQVRRELADRGVQPHHLVVVELPRVGD